MLFCPNFDITRSGRLRIILYQIVAMVQSRLYATHKLIRLIRPKGVKLYFCGSQWLLFYWINTFASHYLHLVVVFPMWMRMPLPLFYCLVRILRITLMFHNPSFTHKTDMITNTKHCMRYIIFILYTLKYFDVDHKSNVPNIYVFGKRKE